MMKRTLEFSIEICRPVAVVYAHFAHPPHLLGLQPLLTWMSPIHATRSDRYQVLSYETVETFRLWGLPIHNNRIQVHTIVSDTQTMLVSYVRSKPDLMLAVYYDFQPFEHGTRLAEHMTIGGPAWLMDFIVGQATQAQQHTLANLKARLEATPEQAITQL